MSLFPLVLILSPLDFYYLEMGGEALLISGDEGREGKLMFIKHPLRSRHSPGYFIEQISSQHPCEVHIIIPIFQLRN